jgi:hypothetical protein
VKEEERPGEGVFARARQAGMDMEALGARLAARKAQLLEQFKTQGLPAPRREPLPATSSNRAGLWTRESDELGPLPYSGDGLPSSGC